MAKQWTEDEQLLALNLYHLLPFGRLHKSAPEIIALAAIMNRTPSSVAMKLCNFASLDSKITESGRTGLKGASKGDRTLWKWHEENPKEFRQKSEQLLIKSGDDDFLSSDDIKSRKIVQTTERVAWLKTRVGQPIFRKMILDNYSEKCCFSGLEIPELLVASHIVPWSKNEEHRLNPKNGLCLSSLHDKAFDIGMWTLDDQGDVVLGKDLLASQSSIIQDAFFEHRGKPLSIGKTHAIDMELMRYHRDEIFTKCEKMARDGR